MKGKRKLNATDRLLDGLANDRRRPLLPEGQEFIERQRRQREQVAGDFLAGDRVTWEKGGGARWGTVIGITAADGLVIVDEAPYGISRHFPAQLQKTLN